MLKQKRTSLKITSILLCACLLLSYFSFASSNKTVSAEGNNIQKEFYVSASGNDNNNGLENSPFATLEKARDQVRKINGSMTGNIIIYVEKGIYYQKDTLVLDERDSGNNGYEIIYKNKDEIGSARIMGGELASSLGTWTFATQDDIDNFDLGQEMLDKVYKLQLNPDEYSFNALYVNDQKAIMARTKNYKHDPRFPMQRGEYMISAGGGCQDITYHNGDLTDDEIAGMVNAQARGEKEIAQIYVWDGGDWDWFSSTLSLGSINAGSRNIKARSIDEEVELNRTKYPIGGNARYFLQGNLSFLDVPGEYHYNKSTGVLYYYPQSGQEDLDAQQIVIPTTTEIIRFEGTDKPEINDYANEPNFDKQVSNVTINGLSLECTDFVEWISSGWNYSDAGGGLWTIPPEAKGSTLTSYCEQTDRTEFKKGAITMINSNNITIENCHIINIGLFGIAIWKDNTNHIIRNCEIENIGYGGITSDGGYPGIGKYNNNHTLNNLSIHDIGTNVGHASGITWMSTGQSHLSHMEIYNSPRRAIMLSGAIRRTRTPEFDGNYDEMRDMYAVGNTFEYINVHDCHQDSGEDSPVYLICLLRGNEVKNLHGISDPTKIINPDTGEPYGDAKANFFNQFVIDSTGANPSMHDKCTVHGFDIAMGGSGTYLSNLKGTNNQSCTLRVEAINDDVYYIDNINNNYKSDEHYDNFDDSKMDYDKIGLTDSFPFKKYIKPESERPDDVYFEDAFEARDYLNKKQWTAEKGTSEIHKGYMSEGPFRGKHSLNLYGDKNPGGVTVSRTFKNDLEKVFTLKFFDRRADYAGGDANEGSHYMSIRPNVFVRADNGDISTQVALGVDGDKSRDYYFYKYGDQTIQTSVHRSFGWHDLTFDYSSGDKVKLFIDEIQVAELEAKSFNYISMTSEKGSNFFDEIYIYGGKEAPPAEDLPQEPIPAQPDVEIFEESFETASESPFVANKGKSVQSIITDPADSENKILYVKSPDDTIFLKDGESWGNYIFEAKIRIGDWKGNLEGPKPWDNMAPVWYATGNSESKPIPRYSLKYNRQDKEFILYRRTGGDSDMIKKAAPVDFLDGWHDYKIVVDNGLMKIYIDDELIFEHSDSSHVSGTIGFDGINVEYYLDDIKLSRQKTVAPSADIESGDFQQSFNLTLTPDNFSDKLVYTIDGTDPTTNGVWYDTYEGIDVSTTTTLKIASIGPGRLYSDVVTYQYVLDGLDEVEKEDLEALIEYAELQMQDPLYKDVVPAVKVALEKALADAKLVVADSAATQVAVNNAYNDLLSKVQMLSFTGNKDQLKLVVANAKAIDKDKYTVETVEVFTEALKTAEDVLLDENALQAEIDSAKKALEDAMDQLELKKPPVEVNKSKLQKKINEAEKIDLSKYLDVNQDKFKAALNAAKTVNSDASATQEQVDKAYQELRDAIFGLRLKPDKSLLEDLISKAKRIDKNLYTPQSMMVFEKALSDSINVYQNEQANQEAINLAVDKLSNSFNRLEKISDTTTPTKTGFDMTMLYMILAIALASVILVIKLRKKRV